MRVRLQAAVAALVAAGVLAGCGSGLAARTPAEPQLEFRHDIELFETTNGLTFALVRDTRTNLATVDVRYDVGAASDPSGLTGLAHLVEHVMFALRAAPGQPTIGDRLHDLALTFNANTTWDETHFTTTVAADRLEEVIELEATRMRATCDQLDEALFERERDIVLEEEAERSSPDSRLLVQLDGIVYGKDHPYARPIGSGEVAHATKADVCAFIEQHYAPSRAYLVVTGPFDVQQVRATIGHAFSTVPAREPLPVPDVPAPVFTGEQRRGKAPIAHPTALVLFSFPKWGAAGSLPYAIGRRLLASELEDADRDEPWIVGTGVTMLGGPRAPVLAVAVEVETADRLDSAAHEVFRRAARLRDYTDFDTSPLVSSVVLDELSRWDDLMDRGGWIADFLQYADHRWFMLDDLRVAAQGWQRHRDEVVAALRPEHALTVLLDRKEGGGRGRVADVRPVGTHELVPWRPPVDPGEADRPLVVGDVRSPVAVERYTLANGLEVALARDDRSPLVDVRLVFPVGTASQPPDEPLLAIAGAYLLGMPPTYVTRPVRIVHSPIRDAFTGDADVDETSTTFSVRGLAEASDVFVPGLDRLLRKGVYEASVLARVRQAVGEEERRALTTDDEVDQLEEVRFRKRLFGAHHPYAASAIAYAPALASLDTRMLGRWKAEHFRARGATLIVSGRFDVDRVKQQIASTFGAWNGSPPADLPPVPGATPPAGPGWLAVEDAAATQVAVRIGFASGSDGTNDRVARAVLAEMVLDQVREVREGLGASYGIESAYLGGAAGSALLVGGKIDETRVQVALPRLIAAIEALRDDDGVRRAAFVRARRRVLGQAQARIAGASSMADQLAAEARQGGTEADLDRQMHEVAAMTLDEVTRIARLDLERTRMTVEVRGRRAAVRGAFAALGATPDWLGQEPGHDDGDGEAGGVAAADTAAPAATSAEAGASIEASTRGGHPTETAPPEAPPTTPAPPAPPEPPEPPPLVDEPESAAARAARLADRLTVGDADNATGPRGRGYYQGDRRISLDEFLRISGHDGEADEIVTRHRTRVALTIVGSLTLAGTAAYAVIGHESCDGLVGQALEDCGDRAHGRSVREMGGVLAGGLLTLLGVELDRRIPDQETLRRYADEYNAQRAHDHAVSGASTPSTRSGPAITIAPAVTGGGAGLVVTGRF
ncbi:MAG TPA: insulinase family protein [Kofleriaceae bacterium]|nr:insulinase family protein [Kofleriaceae bacterium]